MTCSWWKVNWHGDSTAALSRGLRSYLRAKAAELHLNAGKFHVPRATNRDLRASLECHFLLNRRLPKLTKENLLQLCLALRMKVCNKWQNRTESYHITLVYSEYSPSFPSVWSLEFEGLLCAAVVAAGGSLRGKRGATPHEVPMNKEFFKSLMCHGFKSLNWLYLRILFGDTYFFIIATLQKLGDNLWFFRVIPAWHFVRMAYMHRESQWQFRAREKRAAEFGDSHSSRSSRSSQRIGLESDTPSKFAALEWCPSWTSSKYVKINESSPQRKAFAKTNVGNRWNNEINENVVIESCRHFTMMYTTICMGARNRIYRDGQGSECKRNMICQCGHRTLVTQDVPNTWHPRISADNVCVHFLELWRAGQTGCVGCAGWRLGSHRKWKAILDVLRGEIFWVLGAGAKPSRSERKTVRLQIIARGEKIEWHDGVPMKKTHPEGMMFDSARLAKWVAKTSDFLPAWSDSARGIQVWLSHYDVVWCHVQNFGDAWKQILEWAPKLFHSSRGRWQRSTGHQNLSYLVSLRFGSRCIAIRHTRQIMFADCTASPTQTPGVLMHSINPNNM